MMPILLRLSFLPWRGVTYTTRSRVRDFEATSAHECLYINFLSEIEPKRLNEAIKEEGWVIAMQEELNQFERNKVWTLVPVPYGKTIIRTKWIFRNKMDENGVVIKNTARLSAFLNGKISKEVYVQQPPRFESSEFRNHVCKLDKALYGLKQAPIAWYETLLKILIQHKFVRGFQIKQDFKEISICQEKYVKDLLKKYDLADSALVKCPMLPLNNLGPDESEVSVNETMFRGMIGSLMYITASRPDIRFSTCLCARYLKGTLNLGLWYPKGSGFDLKAYSDSDYARCNLDRKITSGGCQILGGKLVCWSAKKQSSVAMSSGKAEYVPIFCDNTSAIAILNNPILHSRTKHIDIRYHFIRDHILKGDIEFHFVPTDLQLADIFTKPLAEPSFTRLDAELGMLNIKSEVSDKKNALNDPLI
ncbi:retrovirus-related pol polyprotein from transposon TNT 1-94 [Tanacetum coccineum]